MTINYLNEGSYFGEISLITNLKRTASVVATDNCTLSVMYKDVLAKAKEEYPQIYLSLRRQLEDYDDFDFNFRRRMILNIPYFK
jgi:CRP-like cAMP-binding protein